MTGQSPCKKLIVGINLAHFLTKIFHMKERTCDSPRGEPLSLVSARFHYYENNNKKKKTRVFVLDMIVGNDIRIRKP